jgi:pilus assembly protein FimV
LRAATGGAGAEWEKAVALGLQFDPGNSLYGGAAAARQSHAITQTQVLSGAGIAAAAAAAAEMRPDTSVHAAESTGLDFDLGAPATTGTQSAHETHPVAAADVTGDFGFDLDLGGEEQKQAAAASSTLSLDAKAPGAPDAATSIDFDFELPVVSEAAPQAQGTVATPAASAAGGGGIDFDFNLDLPAQEAPAAPLDLSLISLELGLPGGVAAPTDAHWQEVATKLDLAKAYQEMGDKDGALELLKEVANEGDAAQQQQAQTMLSALG